MDGGLPLPPPPGTTVGGGLEIGWGIALLSPRPRPLVSWADGLRDGVLSRALMLYLLLERSRTLLSFHRFATVQGLRCR
jgi:hypothetical protein